MSIYDDDGNCGGAVYIHLVLSVRFSYISWSEFRRLLFNRAAGFICLMLEIILIDIFLFELNSRFLFDQHLFVCCW